MTDKTNNNADPLWLKVAVEIKKAANGSTATEMKTHGGGQYVLKTEKAVIRMIRAENGIEIRSADFTDGDFWQMTGDEHARIITEITDGEKAELQKSFGIRL